MDGKFRLLIGCCVALMAALLVVGAVSHGVLRHVVQTSPVCVALVLGLRRSAWTKWAALPCFVFWLLLMGAIWLYLLGWARIVSGTFSPTEIAMTAVVGLASVAGIAGAVQIRSRVRARSAAAIALLVFMLQLTALRVSLLPAIAHR